MKILMTGNPDYGVASGVARIYPSATFISRSTEIAMDLTIPDNQQRLADLSLGYDCFINNSLLADFAQCHILQRVWTTWKENGHHGLIINCGSAVDYLVRPDNRLYGIGKKSLRDLSRNLSLYTTWENSGIRCSYVSFGGVETPKTLSIWPHFTHMSVDDCAQFISWVIQAPPHLNIDELHFTPIQPASKTEMKQRHKNQGKQIPQFNGEYVSGKW